MTLIKNSLFLDLAQVFYIASLKYTKTIFLLNFHSDQSLQLINRPVIKYLRECILKVDNANNLFMASFDIENLFTNIPLHETIEICLNHLFPSPQSTVMVLDRNFFKTILEHSVLNSFFVFANKLYKQIEGVGMGLPMGPTLANVFMCFHEKRWLDDCSNLFKPVLQEIY